MFNYFGVNEGTVQDMKNPSAYPYSIGVLSLLC